MGEAKGSPGGSGRGLLAWIAILGLLGLVLWLASERNAHRYALVPEDGRLLVKKGILFPVGQKPYQPDDAALAPAYAPLAPPPGTALPEEETFEDRSSLDQALYAILAKWARADIASEQPDPLQRALGYLSRADRLAGLSAAQREGLRTLRAESGWFEGRELLERGADALRQARDKLRTAAEAPTRHAAEALSLLRRVEPIADDAFRLSRSAAPEPSPGREGSTPPAAAPDGGAPKQPSP